MPKLAGGFSSAKMIEYVAKLGAGIKSSEDEESGFSEIQMRAIRAVASILSYEKNGLLRCGLCNKRPFTKKGLYLHLIRVHYDEIKGLLEEEIRNTIKWMKHL